MKRKQEREAMTVEILGGPDDGLRLELLIVRESETILQVCGRRYELRSKRTRASEILSRKADT